MAHGCALLKRSTRPVSMTSLPCIKGVWGNLKFQHDTDRIVCSQVSPLSVKVLMVEPIKKTVRQKSCPTKMHHGNSCGCLFSWRPIAAYLLFSCIKRTRLIHTNGLYLCHSSCDFHCNLCTESYQSRKHHNSTEMINNWPKRRRTRPRHDTIAGCPAPVYFPRTSCLRIIFTHAASRSFWLHYSDFTAILR